MFKVVKSIYNFRGFSLLEMLIVVFLGIFLVGVVLQSYLTAKNIYHSQDDLISFNESIRLADYILWKNIMQAGFLGCRRVSELNLDLGREGVIYGYDGDSVRSDVVVISKADSNVTKLNESVESGSGSFKLEDDLKAKIGSVLLISNCSNADLVRIYKKDGKKFYFRPKLKHSYNKENVEIRRFERFKFFVAKRSNEDVLGLYLSTDGTKQELVSGISGMDVFYEAGGKYLRASGVGRNNLWDKVLGVVINLKVDSVLLSENQNRLHVRIRSRSSISRHYEE